MDRLVFLLGKISSLIPECNGKTLARRFAYDIFRRVRGPTRECTFRDVSWRMHSYPLLGGTGLEPTALAGYTKHRDVMAGDTVLDVGAYSGDFTCYAASRCRPGGRVIAFEPDPTSYAMLVRNITLNRLENVMIIRRGLWQEDGELMLTGTAFASQLSADCAKYSLRVPVCSLDRELERLGIEHVDFIKMDIEGAEIEALAGMQSTLAYHPYVAIASYHHRDGLPTSGRVESVLRSVGYRAVTANPSHQTTFGLPM